MNAVDVVGQKRPSDANDLNVVFQKGYVNHGWAVLADELCFHGVPYGSVSSIAEQLLR